MKQTTIAGLLAAIVLLAAVVIVQATRPAEAGGVATQGDPCPADIDNSGTVDVVDFLQLLASWGPCPAPQPVAIASDPTGHEMIARQWSDGVLEFGLLGHGSPGWEWSVAPDSTHVGTVVDVSMGLLTYTHCPSECTAQGAAIPLGWWRIWRLYADGYTEEMSLVLCTDDYSVNCFAWGAWSPVD
ncbi:MAG: hypothetical protein ACYS7M_05050 [Planctomycetota bacterium]|jgi:hypothetical protein